MRRLARWILNGLTVLSLLLCVATVVLWMRSRTQHDYLSCPATSRLELSLVNSENGMRYAAVFHRRSDPYRLPDARSFPRLDIIPRSPKRAEKTFPTTLDVAIFDECFAESYYIINHIGDPLFEYPGASTKWFAHGHGDYPGVRFVEWGAAEEPDFRYASITLPHWAALVVLACLPGVRFVLRFRSRPQFGFCPTCGYDLRATPDRCPECGTVPAAKASA